MASAGRDVDASRAVLAIVRAEGRATSAVQEALAGSDLNATTFNILMEVAASPDGLPLNEIGRRMLKSAPNVTGLVDRLEHCGLVRRSRKAHDRRVVTAEITDKGWKALSDAACRVFAAEQELLSHLSGKELKAIREMLDRADGSGGPMRNSLSPSP
jgi:DNA-binding MarR family transcriptional regulator